jgi:anaerobic selenocysteine-containing dehydrogenase
MGELPVSALAEEILTEGEGQIRALFTSCGNPVLSTPNGSQLDKGLGQLDFMVSIDFYINETTRHADIILPPVSNLESSHYDLIFNALAVRNTAKYSEALFEKPEGAKDDWEIFQELVWRLNGKQGALMTEPPEAKLNLGLMFGRYQLSLEVLKQNPHGIDLGELKESLPDRLMTSSKRIDLAPEVFVKDLMRLKSEENVAAEDDFPFRLIGRRNLRDDNSWLHNSERLMKGKNRCTVWVNHADAKELNLENHEVVKVFSRVGAVEIPCEITEGIARGVISIPHGYGHARTGIRLNVAATYAGVSINDLTDELEIDELTGNAGLNGVRVGVQALKNREIWSK